MSFAAVVQMMCRPLCLRTSGRRWWRLRDLRQGLRPLPPPRHRAIAATRLLLRRWVSARGVFGAPEINCLVQLGRHKHVRCVLRGQEGHMSVTGEQGRPAGSAPSSSMRPSLRPSLCRAMALRQEANRVSQQSLRDRPWPPSPKSRRSELPWTSLSAHERSRQQSRHGIQ